MTAEAPGFHGRLDSNNPLPQEELGSTGKTALFFQGQGSHEVGMGKTLCEKYPSARMIYDAADRALPNLVYNDEPYKISELSFNGPAEILELTRFAQLAILVRNHAWYTVLKEQGILPEPDYVAGLSLGELNAFVAAGAIDFADMLKVVDARAEAMQKACDETPSGKILISAKRTPEGSLTHEQRLSYPGARKEVLDLGLYEGSINAEGNIAFGGTLDQLEAARKIIDENYRKYGIRAFILKVNGAFHTPHMASAVQDVADAVDMLPLRGTTIPVIGNTNALPITNPDDIREEIKRHVQEPVQFYDSLVYLKKNGVSTFIEIGEKPIISGMVRVEDQMLESISTNEGLILAHRLIPKEIAA